MKQTEFAKLVDNLQTHGSALDILLEPDNRYQTRSVLLSTLRDEVVAVLSQGIKNRAPETLPRVIIGYGKCRVGSTALTNLFGIAGLPSYYQPVKTALRCRVLDEVAAVWDLPDVSQHGAVFAKEMAGPYLLAECLFNPIEWLLMAGYPAHLIDLLVVDREPTASLDSWIGKWSDRISREKVVQHYILSALGPIAVAAYAKANGVKVSHWVYECSRDSKSTVQAMFSRLNLSALWHDGVVDDWAEKGSLESASSKVIYPREPAPYVVPGLHASETRFHFKERQVQFVTDEELALIEQFGVPAIYQQHKAACLSEMGEAGKNALG